MTISTQIKISGAKWFSRRSKFITNKRKLAIADCNRKFFIFKDNDKLKSKKR
jgi:hypothetical protein